jgi:hypothetical protein
MSPSRLALAIGAVVFGIVRAGSQAPPTQWLIERVEGVWEVRETGQKERLVNGKYDVITTASMIRCVKQPCILEYSTDGGRAKSIFIKPPVLSQWVPVPRPVDPPVAKTAAELQQMIGRAGVRGGADKAGPACTGDLPLLAPTCFETIDPQDFRLE